MAWACGLESVVTWLKSQQWHESGQPGIRGYVAEV